MDEREIKAIIEGLLFAWGDPLDLKDIANVLEIKEKDLCKVMDELVDEFNFNRRGLRIVKFNNSYQISTRPEHFDFIKKLNNFKNSKTLSNAALETLSIIAYNQPIIKADIESLRGVRCDKAIETLIDRKLVKEVGRLEKPGRPILYGTTEEFLRYFGLESIENLPPLIEKEDNNN